MRFPDPSEREKRARLIALLDEGLVQVHVDARRDGVEVPAHLRDDPMLVLNLSRRFQLDVFEVGPLEVKASLSFGGNRQICVLPWSAVWAMSCDATGERAVFEDAIPPELLAAAEAAAATLAREAGDAGGVAEDDLADLGDDRPQLGEDQADPADGPLDDDEPAAAGPPEDSSPPPPRAPFLRIVK